MPTKVVLFISILFALGIGFSLSRIPTGTAVTIDSAAQVTSEHPRLVASQDDFDALRLRIESNTDSTLTTAFAKNTDSANTILGTTPVTYSSGDMINKARIVLDRVYRLGFMYKMTDDPQYADRAWLELNAVANYPNWNYSTHFLDTAELSHAMAIGYDWMYDYWTPEQRDILRGAITDKGLRYTLKSDGTFNQNGLPNMTGNWNIVCNGGISMAALAIATEDPALADKVLNGSLNAMGNGLASYAPNGGYPEGRAYWGYSTSYLAFLARSLQISTGSDNGILESPGVSQAGLFDMYMTSPTGEGWNAGDDLTTVPGMPSGMFVLADANTDGYAPVYNWWGKQGMAANVLDFWGGGSGISTGPHPLSLLWYKPANQASVQSPDDANLPLDRHMEGYEAVTMRSSWTDPTATFVGLKSGGSQDHGQLDQGNFILDSLGSRWAMDLGRQVYGAPGGDQIGVGGQRWTYYRQRAEGANTLVINPRLGEDHSVLADTHIDQQQSNAKTGFAITDLTDTYPDDITSWKRGVALVDNRQQVIVQDEVAATQNVDTWWFMHTAADMQISTDGRSAVLTKDGKQMLARITSPGTERFYNMAAQPLWNTSNPSNDPSGTNSGVRKLAIHIEGKSAFTLTVQFTPLGQGISSQVLPITPLGNWSLSSLDTSTSVGTAGSQPLAVSAVTANLSSAQRSPMDSVDGNQFTAWSIGSGNWIQYDLGSTQNVNSVAISWLNASATNHKFDIYVPNGSGGWNMVQGFDIARNTRDKTDWVTFPTQSTRYIRIVTQANNYLMSEVAWYGTPAITAPETASYMNSFSFDDDQLTLAMDEDKQPVASIVRKDGTTYTMTALRMTSQDSAILTSEGNSLRGVSEGQANVLVELLDNNGIYTYAVLPFTVAGQYVPPVDPVDPGPDPTDPTPGTPADPTTPSDIPKAPNTGFEASAKNLGIVIAVIAGICVMLHLVISYSIKKWNR